MTTFYYEDGWLVRILKENRTGGRTDYTIRIGTREFREIPNINECSYYECQIYNRYNQLTHHSLNNGKGYPNAQEANQMDMSTTSERIYFAKDYYSDGRLMTFLTYDTASRMHITTFFHSGVVKSRRAYLPPRPHMFLETKYKDTECGQHVSGYEFYDGDTLLFKYFRDDAEHCLHACCSGYKVELDDEFRIRQTSTSQFRYNIQYELKVVSQ
jgi:hypothetical protein